MTPRNLQVSNNDFLRITSVTFCQMLLLSFFIGNLISDKNGSACYILRSNFHDHKFLIMTATLQDSISNIFTLNSKSCFLRSRCSNKNVFFQTLQKYFAKRCNKMALTLLSLVFENFSLLPLLCIHCLSTIRSAHCWLFLQQNQFWNCWRTFGNNESL